jgi:hypothetical protein
MNKKDVTYLLLPSVFFILLARMTLTYAGYLLPDPRHNEILERNIAVLEKSAQNGEFGTNSDGVVKLLEDSWRRKDFVVTTIGNAHAVISRYVGWSLLIGVALQIWVIFRVRAGLRRDVKQSSDGRSAT